jgi:hypothetical protein
MLKSTQYQSASGAEANTGARAESVDTSRNADSRPLGTSGSIDRSVPPPQLNRAMSGGVPRTGGPVPITTVRGTPAADSARLAASWSAPERSAGVNVRTHAQVRSMRRSWG